jgi:hypothetical protein
MRVQVLAAAKMTMTAFWNIAPCSLVEVDRHFRGFIALMIDAVPTTEMSVYFKETTRRYIPESCHPLIIKMMKSRRMGWVGRVAGTGKMRNSYKVLTGTMKGRSHEIRSYIWEGTEDYIKIKS